MMQALPGHSGWDAEHIGELPIPCRILLYLMRYWERRYGCQDDGLGQEKLNLHLADLTLSYKHG